MTVKKFVAASAREALRLVKGELGADAIVVSNRAVADGVEIVAMSPESLEAISHQPMPAPTRPSSRPAAAPAIAVSEDDYTVTLSGKARAQATMRPWSPDATATMPTRANVSSTAGTSQGEKPRARPLPQRDVASHVPS